MSKTVKTRNVKFYTHLDRSSALLGNKNFSTRGSVWGAMPPAYIWDSFVSRKLLELRSWDFSHV